MWFAIENGALVWTMEKDLLNGVILASFGGLAFLAYYRHRVFQGVLYFSLVLAAAFVVGEMLDHYRISSAVEEISAMPVDDVQKAKLIEVAKAKLDVFRQESFVPKAAPFFIPWMLFLHFLAKIGVVAKDRE